MAYVTQEIQCNSCKKPHRFCLDQGDEPFNGTDTYEFTCPTTLERGSLHGYAGATQCETCPMGSVLVVRRDQNQSLRGRR